MLLDSGVNTRSIFYTSYCAEGTTFRFFSKISSFFLRFLSDTPPSSLESISPFEAPVLMAALILPPPFIFSNTFQWFFDWHYDSPNRALQTRWDCEKYNRMDLTLTEGNHGRSALFWFLFISTEIVECYGTRKSYFCCWWFHLLPFWFQRIVLLLSILTAAGFFWVGLSARSVVTDNVDNHRSL